MAELCSFDRDLPYDLQSQRYLLSGLLQDKFADLCLKIICVLTYA